MSHSKIKSIRTQVFENELMDLLPKSAILTNILPVESLWKQTGVQSRNL